MSLNSISSYHTNFSAGGDDNSDDEDENRKRFFCDNEKFEHLMIDRLRADRETIQEKTYKNWINSILIKARTNVTDIYVDLCDGQKLILLLESITGEKVAQPNRGSSVLHKIENVNKCLQFIRQKNVYLESIGPEDIVHGNKRLTLGLIWTIILRFQLSQHLDIPKYSFKTIRDSLLLWCQSKTAVVSSQSSPLSSSSLLFASGNKHLVSRSESISATATIRDFNQSWSDGWAFIELIRAFRPDLLTDFDRLRQLDRVQILEQAFETAAEHLQIPKILDPEDVARSSDENSIITYISYFYNLYCKMKCTETGSKRVKYILTQVSDIQNMCDNYELHAAELLRWIEEKCLLLNASIDVNQANDEMTKFNDYFWSERPSRLTSRNECESLFFEIVTKQKKLGLRSFVPHAGYGAKEIERTWQQLESIEKTRQTKLMKEIRRYKQLAATADLFEQRCLNFETYIAEKLRLLNGINGSNSDTDRQSWRRNPNDDDSYDLNRIEVHLKQSELICCDILANERKFEPTLFRLANELIESRFSGHEFVQQCVKHQRTKLRKLNELAAHSLRNIELTKRVISHMRSIDSIESELIRLRTDLSALRVEPASSPQNVFFALEKLKQYQCLLRKLDREATRVQSSLVIYIDNNNRTNENEYGNIIFLKSSIIDKLSSLRTLVQECENIFAKHQRIAEFNLEFNEIRDEITFVKTICHERQLLCLSTKSASLYSSKKDMQIYDRSSLVHAQQLNNISKLEVKFAEKLFYDSAQKAFKLAAKCDDYRRLVKDELIEPTKRQLTRTISMINDRTVLLRDCVALFRIIDHMELLNFTTFSIDNHNQKESVQKHICKILRTKIQDKDFHLDLTELLEQLELISSDVIPYDVLGARDHDDVDDQLHLNVVHLKRYRLEQCFAEQQQSFLVLRLERPIVMLRNIQLRLCRVAADNVQLVQSLAAATDCDYDSAKLRRALVQTAAAAPTSTTVDPEYAITLNSLESLENDVEMIDNGSDRYQHFPHGNDRLRNIEQIYDLLLSGDNLIHFAGALDERQRMVDFDLENISDLMSFVRNALQLLIVTRAFARKLAGTEATAATSEAHFDETATNNESEVDKIQEYEDNTNEKISFENNNEQKFSNEYTEIDKKEDLQKDFSVDAFSSPSQTNDALNTTSLDPNACKFKVVTYKLQQNVHFIDNYLRGVAFYNDDDVSNLQFKFDFSKNLLRKDIEQIKSYLNEISICSSDESVRRTMKTLDEYSRATHTFDVNIRRLRCMQSIEQFLTKLEHRLKTKIEFLQEDGKQMRNERETLYSIQSEFEQVVQDCREWMRSNEASNNIDETFRCIERHLTNVKLFFTKIDHLIEMKQVKHLLRKGDEFKLQNDQDEKKPLHIKSEPEKNLHEIPLIPPSPPMQEFICDDEETIDDSRIEHIIHEAELIIFEINSSSTNDAHAISSARYDELISQCDQTINLMRSKKKDLFLSRILNIKQRLIAAWKGRSEQKKLQKFNECAERFITIIRNEIEEVKFENWPIHRNSDDERNLHDRRNSVIRVFKQQLIRQRIECETIYQQYYKSQSSEIQSKLVQLRDYLQKYAFEVNQASKTAEILDRLDQIAGQIEQQQLQTSDKTILFDSSSFFDEIEAIQCMVNKNAKTDHFSSEMLHIKSKCYELLIQAKINLIERSMTKSDVSSFMSKYECLTTSLRDHFEYLKQRNRTCRIEYGNEGDLRSIKPKFDELFNNWFLINRKIDNILELIDSANRDVLATGDEVLHETIATTESTSKQIPTLEIQLNCLGKNQQTKPIILSGQLPDTAFAAVEMNGRTQATTNFSASTDFNASAEFLPAQRSKSDQFLDQQWERAGIIVRDSITSSGNDDNRSVKTPSDNANIISISYDSIKDFDDANPNTTTDDDMASLSSPPHLNLASSNYSLNFSENDSGHCELLTPTFDQHNFITSPDVSVNDANFCPKYSPLKLNLEKSDNQEMFDNNENHIIQSQKEHDKYEINTSFTSQSGESNTNQVDGNSQHHYSKTTVKGVQSTTLQPEKSTSSNRLYEIIDDCLCNDENVENNYNKKDEELENPKFFIQNLLNDKKPINDNSNNYSEKLIGNSTIEKISVDESSELNSFEEELKQKKKKKKKNNKNKPQLASTIYSVINTEKEDQEKLASEAKINFENNIANEELNCLHEKPNEIEQKKIVNDFGKKGSHPETAERAVEIANFKNIGEELGDQFAFKKGQIDEASDLNCSEIIPNIPDHEQTESKITEVRIECDISTTNKKLNKKKKKQNKKKNENNKTKNKQLIDNLLEQESSEYGEESLMVEFKLPELKQNDQHQMVENSELEKLVTDLDRQKHLENYDSFKSKINLDVIEKNLLSDEPKFDQLVVEYVKPIFDTETTTLIKDHHQVNDEHALPDFFNECEMKFNDISHEPESSEIDLPYLPSLSKGVNKENVSKIDDNGQQNVTEENIMVPTESIVWNQEERVTSPTAAKLIDKPTVQNNNLHISSTIQINSLPSHQFEDSIQEQSCNETKRGTRKKKKKSNKSKKQHMQSAVSVDNRNNLQTASQIQLQSESILAANDSKFENFPEENQNVFNKKLNERQELNAEFEFLSLFNEANNDLEKFEKDTFELTSNTELVNWDIPGFSELDVLPYLPSEKNDEKSSEAQVENNQQMIPVDFELIDMIKEEQQETLKILPELVNEETVHINNDMPINFPGEQSLRQNDDHIGKPTSIESRAVKKKAKNKNKNKSKKDLELKEKQQQQGKPDKPDDNHDKLENIFEQSFENASLIEQNEIVPKQMTISNKLVENEFRDNNMNIEFEQTLLKNKKKNSKRPKLEPNDQIETIIELEFPRMLDSLSPNESGKLECAEIVGSKPETFTLEQMSTNDQKTLINGSEIKNNVPNLATTSQDDHLTSMQSTPKTNEPIKTEITLNQTLKLTVNDQNEPADIIAEIATDADKFYDKLSDSIAVEQKLLKEVPVDEKIIQENDDPVYAEIENRKTTDYSDESCQEYNESFNTTLELDILDREEKTMIEERKNISETVITKPNCTLIKTEIGDNDYHTNIDNINEKPNFSLASNNKQNTNYDKNPIDQNKSTIDDHEKSNQKKKKKSKKPQRNNSNHQQQENNKMFDQANKAQQEIRLTDLLNKQEMTSLEKTLSDDQETKFEPKSICEQFDQELTSNVDESNSDVPISLPAIVHKNFEELTYLQVSNGNELEILLTETVDNVKEKLALEQAFTDDQRDELNIEKDAHKCYNIAEDGHDETLLSEDSMITKQKQHDDKLDELIHQKSDQIVTEQNDTKFIDDPLNLTTSEFLKLSDYGEAEVKQFIKQQQKPQTKFDDQFNLEPTEIINLPQKPDCKVVYDEPISDLTKFPEPANIQDANQMDNKDEIKIVVSDILIDENSKSIEEKKVDSEIASINSDLGEKIENCDTFAICDPSQNTIGQQQLLNDQINRNEGNTANTYVNAEKRDKKKKKKKRRKNKKKKKSKKRTVQQKQQQERPPTLDNDSITKISIDSEYENEVTFEKASHNNLPQISEIIFDVTSQKFSKTIDLSQETLFDKPKIITTNGEIKESDISKNDDNLFSPIKLEISEFDSLNEPPQEIEKTPFYRNEVVSLQDFNDKPSIKDQKEKIELEIQRPFLPETKSNEDLMKFSLDEPTVDITHEVSHTSVVDYLNREDRDDQEIHEIQPIWSTLVNKPIFYLENINLDDTIEDSDEPLQEKYSLDKKVGPSMLVVSHEDRTRKSLTTVKDEQSPSDENHNDEEQDFKLDLVLTHLEAKVDEIDQQIGLLQLDIPALLPASNESLTELPSGVLTEQQKEKMDTKAVKLEKSHTLNGGKADFDLESLDYLSNFPPLDSIDQKPQMKRNLLTEKIENHHDETSPIGLIQISENDEFEITPLFYEEDETCDNHAKLENDIQELTSVAIELAKSILPTETELTQYNSLLAKEREIMTNIVSEESNNEKMFIDEKVETIPKLIETIEESKPLKLVGKPTNDHVHLDFSSAEFELDNAVKHKKKNEKKRQHKKQHKKQAERSIKPLDDQINRQTTEIQLESEKNISGLKLDCEEKIQNMDDEQEMIFENDELQIVPLFWDENELVCNDQTKLDSDSHELTTIVNSISSEKPELFEPALLHTVGGENFDLQAVNPFELKSENNGPGLDLKLDCCEKIKNISDNSLKTLENVPSSGDQQLMKTRSKSIESESFRENFNDKQMIVEMDDLEILPLFYEENDSCYNLTKLESNESLETNASFSSPISKPTLEESEKINHEKNKESIPDIESKGQNLINENKFKIDNQQSIDNKMNLPTSESCHQQPIIDEQIHSNLKKLPIQVDEEKKYNNKNKKKKNKSKRQKQKQLEAEVKINQIALEQKSNESVQKQEKAEIKLIEISSNNNEVTVLTLKRIDASESYNDQNINNRNEQEIVLIDENDRIFDKKQTSLDGKLQLESDQQDVQLECDEQDVQLGYDEQDVQLELVLSQLEAKVDGISRQIESIELDMTILLNSATKEDMTEEDYFSNENSKLSACVITDFLSIEPKDQQSNLRNQVDRDSEELNILIVRKLPSERSYHKSLEELENVRLGELSMNIDDLSHSMTIDEKRKPDIQITQIDESEQSNQQILNEEVKEPRASIDIVDATDTSAPANVVTSDMDEWTAIESAQEIDSFDDDYDDGVDLVLTQLETKVDEIAKQIESIIFDVTFLLPSESISSFESSLDKDVGIVLMEKEIYENNETSEELRQEEANHLKGELLNEQQRQELPNESEIRELPSSAKEKKSQKKKKNKIKKRKNKSGPEIARQNFLETCNKIENKETILVAFIEPEPSLKLDENPTPLLPQVDTQLDSYDKELVQEEKIANDTLCELKLNEAGHQESSIESKYPKNDCSLSTNCELGNESIADIYADENFLTEYSKEFNNSNLEKETQSYQFSNLLPSQNQDFIIVNSATDSTCAIEFIQLNQKKNEKAEEIERQIKLYGKRASQCSTVTAAAAAATTTTTTATVDEAIKKENEKVIPLDENQVENANFPNKSMQQLRLPVRDELPILTLPHWADSFCSGSLRKLTKKKQIKAKGKKQKQRKKFDNDDQNDSNQSKQQKKPKQNGEAKNVTSNFDQLKKNKTVSDKTPKQDDDQVAGTINYSIIGLQKPLLFTSEQKQQQSEANLATDQPRLQQEKHIKAIDTFEQNILNKTKVIQFNYDKNDRVDSNSEEAAAKQLHDFPRQQQYDEETQSSNNLFGITVKEDDTEKEKERKIECNQRKKEKQKQKSSAKKEAIGSSIDQANLLYDSVPYASKSDVFEIAVSKTDDENLILSEIQSPSSGIVKVVNEIEFKQTSEFENCSNGEPKKEVVIELSSLSDNNNNNNNDNNESDMQKLQSQQQQERQYDKILSDFGIKKCNGVIVPKELELEQNYQQQKERDSATTVLDYDCNKNDERQVVEEAVKQLPVVENRKKSKRRVKKNKNIEKKKQNERQFAFSWDIPPVVVKRSSEEEKEKSKDERDGEEKSKQGDEEKEKENYNLDKLANQTTEEEKDVAEKSSGNYMLHTNHSYTIESENEREKCAKKNIVSKLNEKQNNDNESVEETKPNLIQEFKDILEQSNTLTPIAQRHFPFDPMSIPLPQDSDEDGEVFQSISNSATTESNFASLQTEKRQEDVLSTNTGWPAIVENVNKRNFDMFFEDFDALETENTITSQRTATSTVNQWDRGKEWQTKIDINVPLVQIEKISSEQSVKKLSTVDSVVEISGGLATNNTNSRVFAKFTDSSTYPNRSPQIWPPSSPSHFVFAKNGNFFNSQFDSSSDDLFNANIDFMPNAAQSDVTISSVAGGAPNDHDDDKNYNNSIILSDIPLLSRLTSSAPVASSSSPQISNEETDLTKFYSLVKERQKQLSPPTTCSNNECRPNIGDVCITKPISGESINAKIRQSTQKEEKKPKSFSESSVDALVVFEFPLESAGDVEKKILPSQTQRSDKVSRELSTPNLLNATERLFVTDGDDDDRQEGSVEDKQSTTYDDGDHEYGDTVFERRSYAFVVGGDTKIEKLNENKEKKVENGSLNRNQINVGDDVNIFFDEITQEGTLQQQAAASPSPSVDCDVIDLSTSTASPLASSSSLSSLLPLSAKTSAATIRIDEHVTAKHEKIPTDEEGVKLRLRPKRQRKPHRKSSKQVQEKNDDEDTEQNDVGKENKKKESTTNAAPSTVTETILGKTKISVSKIDAKNSISNARLLPIGSLDPDQCESPLSSTSSSHQSAIQNNKEMINETASTTTTSESGNSSNSSNNGNDDDDHDENRGDGDNNNHHDDDNNNFWNRVTRIARYSLPFHALALTAFVVFSAWPKDEFDFNCLLRRGTDLGVGIMKMFPNGPPPQ